MVSALQANPANPTCDILLRKAWHYKSGYPPELLNRARVVLGDDTRMHALAAKLVSGGDPACTLDCSSGSSLGFGRVKWMGTVHRQLWKHKHDPGYWQAPNDCCTPFEVLV